MPGKNTSILLTILVGFILLSHPTMLVAADAVQKAETIICPVSHEVVEKTQAVGPVSFEGTDYYFCCAGCQTKFNAEPGKYLHTAIDIVCGMTVDPAKAGKLEHQGKAYYFCNEKCKVAFEKNPENMIKKAQAKDKAQTDGKAAKAGCGNCNKRCGSDKAK